MDFENNVVAYYETELNKESTVQECDATMLNRITIAGYIKSLIT
jgi:hypothetical protein